MRPFSQVGSEEDDRAVISVRVLPRSSSNQILGKEAGVFKVKLTAPPVEGMANKSLTQFLAKRLGVPRRSVEIISGERSRIKSVQIRGLSLGDVHRILEKDT
ncbi:MAG TPA: DUF167 domain-containing protein [Acidobacteriota bacterium]|nr:DUF167 domain-containing protein [Acidobacteriota bacterium]